MADRVDYLHQPWYVMADDLVGGWCIMNVAKTPSECDASSGEHEVGSFLSEEIALHIVALHNGALERRMRPSLPATVPLATGVRVHPRRHR